MKRYNRWLAITAAASQRDLIPVLVAVAVVVVVAVLVLLFLLLLVIAVVVIAAVWTKFYCQLDRSFRPTSFCNYYDFYSSPEQKPRSRILCPCGRTLIKCWRLAALRALFRDGENQTVLPLFKSAVRNCEKIQDDSTRNIIAWHARLLEGWHFCQRKGAARKSALGCSWQYRRNPGVVRDRSVRVQHGYPVNLYHCPEFTSDTVRRGEARAIDRKRRSLTQWIIFQTVNSSFYDKVAIKRHHKRTKEASKGEWNL